MTLIEAIETGKQFKRPNHDHYITIANFEGYKDVLVWLDKELPRVNFTVESLKADDWEIKE